MMIQIEVDNETARVITASGMDLDETIRTLLDTAAVGLQRPGCWERGWLSLVLGDECFAQAKGVTQIAEENSAIDLAKRGED